MALLNEEPLREIAPASLAKPFAVPRVPIASGAAPALRFASFVQSHKLALAVLTFSMINMLATALYMGNGRLFFAGVTGVLISLGLIKTQKEEFKRNSGWMEVQLWIGRLFFGIPIALVIALMVLVISAELGADWGGGWRRWTPFQIAFAAGQIVGFAIVIAILAVLLGLSEKFGFFRVSSWMRLMVDGVLPVSLYLFFHVARPDLFEAVDRPTEVAAAMGSSAASLSAGPWALLNKPDLAQRPAAASKLAALATQHLQELAIELAQIQNESIAADELSTVREHCQELAAIREQSRSVLQGLPAWLQQRVQRDLSQQLGTSYRGAAAKVRRELERLAGEPRFARLISERPLRDLVDIELLMAASRAAIKEQQKEFEEHRQEMQRESKKRELEWKLDWLGIGKKSGYLQDWLMAETLVRDDELLFERMRWCPALDLPMVNLHWGFAVDLVGAGGGSPNNLLRMEATARGARRRENEEPWGLVDTLKKLTGDIGLWLGQGLQSRVDEGVFGYWNPKGEERWHWDRRGITLVGIAPEESLLKAARYYRLDVLIVNRIETKRTEVGRRPTNWITLRLFNVRDGELLWESSRVSDAQRGARQRTDPFADIVEAALTYIDDNIRLVDVPVLTAEAAAQRAEQASNGELFNPVAALAEVYYYYRRELISAADAERHFAAILGKKLGPLLASPDPLERFGAFESLLPRR